MPPLKVSVIVFKKIDKWMSQNFLQLNKNKTEVVVFGKKEERQKISALLERKGLIAKDTF